MPTPLMNQNYTTLNDTFGVQNEEHVINERLLFNSEMLDRCRQDCKHYISRSLTEYGGKMVKDDLQLIDIRTVHPAGKEITNNKTGQVLPKGFQIRYDTNVDNAHKKTFLRIC